MFTNSLSASIAHEQTPLIQLTSDDSLPMPHDNSNLDLELGLISRITHVLNRNTQPTPQQNDWIIARDTCLNNLDILIEIANFLQDTQFSRVCHFFHEANTYVCLHDKEIAFLLDRPNGTDPITLKMAVIYKREIEKSLRWLNPIKLTEFKSTKSHLELVPYTKTLLQEVSTTKLVKPDFYRNSNCGIMSAVATSLLSGTAFFWSFNNNWIVSHHPTTRYFNTTDGHTFDVEELKTTGQWFEIFSLIMLISSVAFFIFTIYSNRKEERKKQIFLNEAPNYLKLMNKCSKIVQDRASPALLDPPPMDQVTHEIPRWFRNTYINHPRTTYTFDNQFSTN